MLNTNIISAKEAPKESRKIIESELVNRAKSGDTRAFDLLVERVQDTLKATLRNKVWNESDREDLFCQVIERAWRSIGKFRGECSFSTWTFVIALREVDTYRRQQIRAAKVFLSFTADPSEDADEVTFGKLADTKVLTPTRQAISVETLEEIDRALGELSPKHREAIIASLNNDRINSTAEDLKITRGTAGSRLMNARRALEWKLVNRDVPIPKWGRRRA